jgi:hypothetical protein
LFFKQRQADIGIPRMGLEEGGGSHLARGVEKCFAKKEIVAEREIAYDFKQEAPMNVYDKRSSVTTV